MMICDDCEYLGSNGVCGYCRFTYECYDGKEDLGDDKRLPNCPFKTDFIEWALNKIEEKNNKIMELEEIINFKDEKINLLKKCLKQCL